ncbi:helix-turn-helix domain-containing protein [Streptomyces sp. 4N509B]|uniref:helix-turn-helix domain-containing protein n=1 Tax=Streptomyces sp. 4N509B TaxID=3457413 RepID=UPI003FD1A0CF
MSDPTELLTIGQLARRTGLSVRTIRFWSDSGVVAPTSRSAGGYRLYDAGAVARLDLVRTLRELGLDLDTVRRVLARQVTVRDVAEAHVRALDAEIRTLQVRRAVVRRVARHGGTTEEMRLMHELARMSARERRRVIEDFVHATFDGVDPDAPGAHIAQAMRTLPAELPADRTPEQVDAWVELAELVNDEAFRARARAMAVAGARVDREPGEPGEPGEPEGSRAAAAVDPERVAEHARGAVRDGVDPGSPEGRRVLARIVDPGLTAAERARLADTLATFTDRRVERYWQLLGVLNGWPPVPSQVPAFEWLIAALRASATP